MTQTEQLFKTSQKFFRPVEGMKETIISEWLRQVKEKVPAANRLEEPELVDSLPSLLDQLLVSVAEQPQFCAQDGGEIRQICKNHATQRSFFPEYDLKQILLEYNILRKILFRAIDKKHVTAIKKFREDILDIIHIGEISAAEKYSQIAIEKEKSNLETICLSEQRLRLALESSQLDFLNLKSLEVKLRENIEKLEVEKELREQFVSTLSHDLRTPLTAARINLQLLDKASAEENKVRCYTRKIQACLSRADHMIQDLLDANRIRAGQPIAVEITTCDLHEIVQDAVNELRTLYGERFEIVGQQDIKGFWGKESLRRILDNLLSNAIKYGEAFKKISIKLSSEEDWIEISIHNEGQQIPENRIAQLFEPFHREQASSQKLGWGLGLTLVKGMAAAHGGSVRVTSHKDDGTTFFVRLPIDARKYQQA